MRSRLPTLGLWVCILTAACGVGGRGGDVEPRTDDLTLRVENQNFYDATIYLLTTIDRIRLGDVAGQQTRTFSFAWRDFDLQIEVHLVGVGSFVSELISVNRGDAVDLIIEPDAHRKRVRRRP